MYNLNKIGYLAGVSFLMSCLVGSYSLAQETQSKSTTMNRWIQHYYDRVKLFQDENKTYKKVVMVGDSITEGFKLDQYFPGQPFINRGIGSDGIGFGQTGLLKRLDSSVFDCNPSQVFILIGINDLPHGHSMDTLAAGYRNVLAQIKGKIPNVPVYVISVLPCRGRYAYLNPLVLEFNTRLKSLAAEFQYQYLDLHSLLKDDKGELKEEYTGDGLHLKPPAYEIWKTEIDKVLGTTNTSPSMSNDSTH
ncbi:MAG: GDSL-type esterase/lipase family protein [bacterium]